LNKRKINRKENEIKQKTEKQIKKWKRKRKKLNGQAQ
jgi:hypothetical protein